MQHHPHRRMRLPLFGLIFASLVALALVPISPAAAADTQAPSVPTGVSGTATSSTSITLRWNVATDNVAIDRYRVIRNGKAIGNSTNTTFTDRSVSGNTDYWYRIQTIDSSENVSVVSDFVQITTPARGAVGGPTQPTGLSGKTANGRVDLSWNPASAGAGVANYKITRSGKVVGTATSTNWTDTNVTPGNDYWYRITAVDNNGRSSTMSDWIRIKAAGGNQPAPPANPPAPEPPAPVEPPAVEPPAPVEPPAVEPPLPVGPPPNNNGWRLVWSDEFSGTTLDTSKWSVERSNFGHPNGTLQCYRTDNAVVSGGTLRLVAKQQSARCSGTNKNYTSGMVHTKNRVDWLYGRFEIRAKTTAGKGMFPALWLSSSDKTWGSWPRSGEIDIMEQIGQRPNIMAGSIHWGNTTSPQRKVTEYFSPTPLTQAFHTYAIEWEPGAVRWFIDDQLYATSTAADGWFVPGGGGGAGAPFNKDFFLIMNLAVGHDWPGAPNAQTPFPNDFQIDYVRVYQR